jgi:hypothetical protein
LAQRDGAGIDWLAANRQSVHLSSVLTAYKVRKDLASRCAEYLNIGLAVITKRALQW